MIDVAASKPARRLTGLAAAVLLAACAQNGSHSPPTGRTNCRK